MFRSMAEHLRDQYDRRHGSERGHSHGHGKHGHTHGTIDPSITTSERGIWAIKWSFIGLAVTALLQIVVVWLSQSVGLLADAIHNFGDAATAIPLWIAFMLSRWKPNEKFTYGYGRVEDLAGMEDQANLPGTVDQYPNWRRKLPLDIEQIARTDLFRDVTEAVAPERPRRP